MLMRSWSVGNETKILCPFICFTLHHVFVNYVWEMVTLKVSNEMESGGFNGLLPSDSAKKISGITPGIPTDKKSI